MNFYKSILGTVILLTFSLSNIHATAVEDPFLDEVRTLQQKGRTQSIDLVPLLKTYPMPQTFDAETDNLWKKRLDALEMLLFVNFSKPGLDYIAQSHIFLGLAQQYLLKGVTFNARNQPYNEAELCEAVFSFYHSRWMRFQDLFEKTTNEIKSTNFEDLTLVFLTEAYRAQVKRVYKSYFAILPGTQHARPEWKGIAECDRPQVLGEIKHNLMSFHMLDLQYFAWTAQYIEKRSSLVAEIYEYASALERYMQSGQENPQPLPPMMEWVNQLNTVIRISKGA